MAKKRLFKRVKPPKKYINNFEALEASKEWKEQFLKEIG